MPELLARSRLLCGHRPGAAGSPENLIGGDREVLVTTTHPVHSGPMFRDPQLMSWRTTRPGRQATAQLNQSSAHSPGYEPCQACPKPLVWLACLSVPPATEREKHPKPLLG